MNDFRGKVAVVTGGGSGIGRALVLALAVEGTDVVVADVEVTAAEAVRDEAAALGARAIAAQADVSRRDEVEALADAAYAEFGRADILCNNAGVVRRQHTRDMTAADWDWVSGVNLQGVIHGVQAFLPRMLAHGEGGYILNTASVAGFHVYPGRRLASYSITKCAVVALSEDLHEELAEFGIGASVLCPGGVRTRLDDAGRNRPEALGGPLAEDHIEKSGDMDPAEVARLALAGIRDNQLYIVTHPNNRPVVEERFSRILAAWDWLERHRQPDRA